MKLQKLALTALALSMSTAFAAGNTDKQAEGSSANQASMAQSASANQPSSSTANQSASSTANQSASGSTNGSQSGMSSSEGATAQADPQVRQVQQALKDKGIDPGPVDGIMGPQTQQALQSFQQQQGISGSGQLDQQTLAALGVQGDGAPQGSSLSSSADQASSSSANQASSSAANQPSSGTQASSSANQGSSSTNQGYTKQ